MVDLVRGAGQRPPDVYHVQHLRAPAQADEVLVVAAQAGLPHVAALRQSMTRPNSSTKADDTLPAETVSMPEQAGGTR